MNRNNKHLRTLRRLTALMLAAVFLWAVALPAFAEGTEAAQSDTVYINSASDLVSFAQRCAVDSWSKGKTVILQEDLSLQGVGAHTLLQRQPVRLRHFAGHRPPEQGGAGRAHRL